MDLKALLHDPRRRTLAVLALLAIFSLVWAGMALERRAGEVAPKYPAHAFLPGFAGELDHASRIHIVSKKYGAFDAVFVPVKGWVLPGRDNFPVSDEEMHKTLVGLAALQTIAPKTAEPGWYHYLDLGAPPAGDGVLIEVRDDKGRVLASLIAGKTQDIGDPSGAIGLYVRKTGEAQSWLVNSPFVPHAGQADWMDKKIVELDSARIAGVDVRPAKGPAYTLSRDKPSDADFTLIGPVRELADPGAPDSVATALAGFSFEDAAPAAGFDFTSGASRLITRTFDGLIVTVDVIARGQENWARVYAGSVPGKPDAEKEASVINAHAAGWAFKLPSYKAAQFTTPLDSLLRPRSGK